jgi:lipopolysaccharide export system protein LptA
MPSYLFLIEVRRAAAGLALAALTLPALADKADRTQPMTLESDKPCVVDLAKQLSSCSGNVVIAQGTLQIRAERIEIRETPEGWRNAVAIGSAAKPASYRQRRGGGGGEYVEGSAERIEFDGRADTLKFTGSASVRRVRDGRVADEIQGATIVWDNTAELFSVQGGAPSAGNPDGRVRAVLAPRGAEASASAATGVGSGTAPLKSSGGLGERR